jgi:hypothetical protein
VSFWSFTLKKRFIWRAWTLCCKKSNRIANICTVRTP